MYVNKATKWFLEEFEKYAHTREGKLYLPKIKSLEHILYIWTKNLCCLKWW